MCALKIDCISDLHGEFPVLSGGDLLIVAGDLTAHDWKDELQRFFKWLNNQEYRKKVFIAGNHDNRLCNRQRVQRYFGEAEYLFDSGTEFEGLKIWGSPWTKRFYGQNPECMAFSLTTDSQMYEKFLTIPVDTDILVTHTPPLHILDQTYKKRTGCSHLRQLVLNSIKPKLHVFGHIHEAYGQETHGDTIFVNAAQMDERYRFVNLPITIEL